MKILKEIFNDDELYKTYNNNFNASMNVLQKCKSLYEIENFMQLDMSIEKTNEAKIMINYCLTIIENILVQNTILLNPLKDKIKLDKITKEISYETLNAKLKDTMNYKDFDKRKDKSVLLGMKESQVELRKIESNLEILKMEIKQVERLRETINDQYMALKKKYDAMIKYNVV